MHDVCEASHVGYVDAALFLRAPAERKEID